MALLLTHELYNLPWFQALTYASLFSKSSSSFFKQNNLWLTCNLTQMPYAIKELLCSGWKERQLSLLGHLTMYQVSKTCSEQNSSLFSPPPFCITSFLSAHPSVFPVRVWHQHLPRKWDHLYCHIWSVNLFSQFYLDSSYQHVYFFQFQLLLSMIIINAFEDYWNSFFHTSVRVIFLKMHNLTNLLLKLTSCSYSSKQSPNSFSIGLQCFL